MHRHIVTGGSGFLGSYLVDQLLARGEEVVIFDVKEPPVAIRAGLSYVRGDVRNRGDLERLQLRGSDVVHHLAARIYQDVPRFPEIRDAWFAEVNVSGTRNVLDAMRKAGAARATFFSTDMVYGVPTQTPLTTTHPRAPLGPYGRSKRDAEDLIATARAEGASITVFRPRFITGAGRFGLLSKLFALIARGLPVPMIGDGSNRYQMVAASDCARAVILAIERGLPAGPFHLGSLEPPRVRDLLHDLIGRVGSRSMLVPTPAYAVKATLGFLDRCGLALMYPEQFLVANEDYVLDLSETREALGFVPMNTDADMMSAAYDAFLVERKSRSG